MANYFQLIEELNALLALNNLCIKPFQELQLPKSRSHYFWEEYFQGVELYLIVSGDELKKNKLLDLKEYAVLGIVYKDNTLILIRSFLKSDCFTLALAFTNTA